ncbi:MAG: glycine cleavage system protein R [Gallionellales bacterium RIFCSPLOWO2_02_FULL_57_47]|nr:MAG: glycine cleavage system protein R [Gallionellales bacterium RIFCSPLOWO2_02_FULL_57_47]OGT18416.1 MAG: glycine cleavage system protein R [Gallionellales bacterium RIFCSPHIGHO2_02_FULL_57_16]
MNTDTQNEYLMITASGEDKVGLVDQLSSKISESGCNIEESRMAVLGGQFALIMLISGPWNALSKLEGQMDALGGKLGLTIIHNRTHKRGRTPAAPYNVEVVAMDHPGIVHSLSAFFSRNGINIEELQTDTYPAPHTGTPMFSVTMTVGIPAGTHIPTLRGNFLDYCDDLNLDVIFEPVRG